MVMVAVSWTKPRMLPTELEPEAWMTELSMDILAPASRQEGILGGIFLEWVATHFTGV